MTTLDGNIPLDAYANAAGELRALARVLRAALGIVLVYWTTVERLPEAHPYRQAAAMVDGYLKRRYKI